MVVRIVHGQAGSLYSALLREAGSNTQEKSKDVQAKVANPGSASAQQATSDAVKVNLSSRTSAGQGISQMAQVSALSEIVTTSKSARTSSGERIESYKEAKQVTHQLIEEMRDEPGKSVEAHNVSGLSVQGSRM